VNNKDLTPASRRNFGLDVVRSVAILSVLASHSLYFLFPFYYRQLVEAFGILGSYGVEIFFVLSGFLIGQLIVKEVLSPPSVGGLGHFWVRRWLRTLPPYFLVLGLRTAIGHPFDWRYLVFLQNFDPKALASFPVSWRLSIEEWFYLLTPLVLLLAARLSRGRRPAVFFATCAAIAGLALVGRVFAVLRWNLQVRDHIFLRMDTLMIGVVLGGLRAYHRATYDRIARHRHLLFLAGCAGIAATAAWLALEIRQGTVNRSILMRTVFFDPLSISVGLVILGLESSVRVNQRWSSRGWSGIVRFVSLSSYSMYLIHLTAFEPFWRLNARTGSVRQSLGWMAAALAISFLLAAVLYLYFERPILRFRDRVTASRSPTIERAAPASAAATAAEEAASRSGRVESGKR
jgi:peptidoglycan/LPS O-acetylase OafA/YrhL